MTAASEELKEKSRVRIFKVIFPNTTNHYDTLFGGKAMEMMDEAAFIAATRYSRKKMVTISTGRIDFKEPIPADTLIELVAEVIEVGRTSLKVQVDIYKEEMYSADNRRKAITGFFSLVALGNNNKPTKVL